MALSSLISNIVVRDIAIRGDPRVLLRDQALHRSVRTGTSCLASRGVTELHLFWRYGLEKILAGRSLFRSSRHEGSISVRRCRL